MARSSRWTLTHPHILVSGDFNYLAELLQCDFQAIYDRASNGGILIRLARRIRANRGFVRAISLPGANNELVGLKDDKGRRRIGVFGRVFRRSISSWASSAGARDNGAETRFREPELPELSRFFGIIIAMYYNDHSPPHFHAKYGGDQASIRIDNGTIVEGKLGTRTMRLVEEWRVLHEVELLEDWNRARARQPLNQIEPLE